MASSPVHAPPVLTGPTIPTVHTGVLVQPLSHLFRCALAGVPLVQGFGYRRHPFGDIAGVVPFPPPATATTAAFILLTFVALGTPDNIGNVAPIHTDLQGKG